MNVTSARHDVLDTFAQLDNVVTSTKLLVARMLAVGLSLPYVAVPLITSAQTFPLAVAWNMPSGTVAECNTSPASTALILIACLCSQPL